MSDKIEDNKVEVPPVEITEVDSPPIEEDKPIRPEINSQLKSLLVEKTESGETRYHEFLKNFVETATLDSNSKAAMFLAKAFFEGGLLEELDASSKPAVDAPLLEYNLSKLCFDKQLQIIHDSSIERKLCVMTSRRAGKSMAMARLMVKMSLIPKTPILYVGLTQSAGIEQTFDEVLTLCSKIGYNGVKPDRLKGVMTFPNGSKIKWSGNHTIPEQEALRGGKYRLVIIDECQSQRMMYNLIDNVLRPTLADFPDSVLVLSGTPPRVKKSYFENVWNSGTYKNYHWNSSSNPYIPDWEGTIKDVCKEKGLSIDDPLIQREYYGRIVYDTTALIFHEFKTYKPETMQGSYLPENPLDPVTLTPGVFYSLPPGFVPEYLYIGVDWGFADKYAVALMACSVSHKQAYVVYEAKDSRKASSVIIQSVLDAYKYAEAIRQKFPQVRAIEVYGDTNEGALISELNSVHHLPAFPAYKVNKDIHMDLLADLSRSSRLLVPENSCLADEMERTVHPRDERGTMLPGIDSDAFHPDILDALLYASRRFMFDLGMESAQFREPEKK